MERYLERFIENDILSWKNNPNHRALEINGGRQIGKTTTLKKFVAEGIFTMKQWDLVVEKYHMV